MNSYERIYNILTESTPAGREGSKQVGRKAAKDIAKLNPAPGYPIDVPERYAQDDIRATAKEAGDEAIKSDPAGKAAREHARVMAIKSRSSRHRNIVRGGSPNPTIRGRTPAGNPLTPGGRRIYRTEAGVKTYRRNPSKTSVHEPTPEDAAKRGVKPGSYWDK